MNMLRFIVTYFKKLVSFLIFFPFQIGAYAALLCSNLLVIVVFLALRFTYRDRNL